LKIRSAKRPIFSEINITPFTDVVLVLLVIFMIATPLIYQGIDLPQTKNAQRTDQRKNMTIVVDEQGAVLIEGVKFRLPGEEDLMKSKISSSLGTNPDSTVLIDADRNCKYDYVIRVIEAVKSTGVKKITLGTVLKK
jgi:biopolymer transport protein ExbD